MENWVQDRRVAIARCHEYDAEKLYALIQRQLEQLGIGPETFRGKNVLIKPNLVSKKDPMQAATTHPEVMRATVRLLKDCGARVLVAESPGGLYTRHSLEESYKASGFLEIAQAEGAVFNYDTAAEYVKAPDGQICKEFHMISPVGQADLIVSLCKLKTHGLTKMTAGVKNLYGTIPGVEKVEMHGRFSKAQDFCTMLVDLGQCVCQRKPLITICDGILAMEGDGPGTGDPRYLDALLTGCNPFALDLACCALIGFGDTVPMVEIAKKRGLCPKTVEELEILGVPIQDLAVTDFKEPRSQKLPRQIKMIPDFVKPRPIIDRDACRGCGVCVRSCPKETIRIENKKAIINKKNCIRCFCCQEMCPYKAVSVKRSVIFEKILK